MCLHFKIFGFIYITDSGLIVPCASPSLRGLLNETMNKLGISVERRSETIARAVAEVSLHLLGGPHRLTPKNSHQKPVVVVLCGNHPEAAGVVCAARHLATLGVTTIIYLQGLTFSNYMVEEIELYKLTGQSIINNETSINQFFFIFLFSKMKTHFEFRIAQKCSGSNSGMFNTANFQWRRNTKNEWDY